MKQYYQIPIRMYWDYWQQLKQNKMKVTVTAVALPTINETINHYVVIGEGETKIVIRCGETNYNKLKAMETNAKAANTGKVDK